MRIIAGLLLLAAFAMHLLLGGGALISSRYEELEARSAAGDLSDVAGDLVDVETLAKERAATQQRLDNSSARQKLVLGAVLLALALAQAAGGVLLFLGRARRFVLAVVAGSLLAGAGALLLSRSIVGGVGIGLLLLALGAMLLEMRRRPAPLR